jgi:hypothetical protein
MIPEDAFNNLNLIMLFAGCVLPLVATPIGFGIAFVVRRTMPMVNILTATILASYIVSVVIVFALIRAISPDPVFNPYSAAFVSLMIAAGILFSLVYFIHRQLLAHAGELETKVKEEHTFSVMGEDVRDKRNNLRRKP